MSWQEELKSKFVHSEDNPSQDNYGECFLDGDPLKLEDFITSLLEKQRESCADRIKDMNFTLAEIVRITPEPK